MTKTTTQPPVTVRLSDKARDGVTHVAKITKRSRSFVINEAVERYLIEEAAYLRELDEATASLEKDGGYAWEEVSAWLDTWGTDASVAAYEAMKPQKV